MMNDHSEDDVRRTAAVEVPPVAGQIHPKSKSSTSVVSFAVVVVAVLLVFVSSNSNSPVSSAVVAAATTTATTAADVGIGRVVTNRLGDARRTGTTATTHPSIVGLLRQRPSSVVSTIAKSSGNTVAMAVAVTGGAIPLLSAIHHKGGPRPSVF
jgi:hypothetical protein